MQGSDILPRAAAHLNEKYVLGAHAPLENSGWTGPWDCAEYCSWLVYQTYGIVYGCGTTGLEGADPYSGYWADDATKRGILIPVAQAAATPGAFLVRKATATPKMIGHVAIAIGDGHVYEAAGAQLGVRIGPIAGRRWDLGVLLPGVTYSSSGALPAPVLFTGVPFVLRRQATPAHDDHVVALQTALKDRLYDPGTIDGLFGEATESAVYSFQVAQGLIHDGEVGPTTGRALGLPYWDGLPAGGVAPSPGSVSAQPALASDAFGTVVNTSSNYTDIRAEYEQLFSSCTVSDRNGEIAELSRRIAANKERYAGFVAGYAGKPCAEMPWFFVALVHAMEASGDIGHFKTHLHNGDPLTRPTTHVPRGRPNPNGANFTWEESARDALALEGCESEGDWSLPRMLFRLERYNGMGPRHRGHATAYLWSYTNHYIKGKYVGDGVWDDNAVSRQPGAAAILEQLVTDGVAVVS